MTNPAVVAFQSELKNKIQFKASSKVSNDAVLFKAFKFFDLYNNGTLNRADFFKAIAKCGVVVDTHDVDLIYKNYDPQATGKIDYRVFIEKLLFSSTSETSSEQLERSQLLTAPKNEQPSRSPQQNLQPDRFSEHRSQHSPSDKLKQSHLHREPESYAQAVEIVLAELRGDGICGLLNLANQLKATDYERTHLISLQKMQPLFRYLSQRGLSLLASSYNPNKFGEINYAELVYGLRGNMNLQRQALIDDLFNMLDGEQKGQIEIPKIVAAYRNRSQIGTFKRAIDLYCKFQSIDDGIFTDEDFNDFFEFLSFGFSSDLSFHEFVKIGFYSEQPPRSSVSNKSSRREFEIKKQNSVKETSKLENVGDFRKNKQFSDEFVPETGTFKKEDFHLDREDDRKSHVSSQSRRLEAKLQAQEHKVDVPEVKQINMVLLRMKKTLSSKGTRGFLQFEKLLKANDTDNDGRVNLDQFKQVIKQQKIDITQVEATQIFKIFDSQKNGLMNFQEIIGTLKGETPQNRQAIISRLWHRVKIDEEHTTFSKVRSGLNFRSHPDIQTGRKHDDQVWNEIQETILMIQDLNGNGRSDTIYKEVFEQYCQNLSLSVQEDQLFESIAQNFWKVGPVTRIEDEYAGSRKVFDPKKSAYLQDHHKYAYNGVSVSQSAPFGTFNIPTDYTTEHRQL